MSKRGSQDALPVAAPPRELQWRRDLSAELPWIAESAWAMALVPYDTKFYRSLDATAEVSARKVLPLLLALCPVGSAVDLGCGDGGWLAACRARGVEDVMGLDGPWVDAALLKIPSDRFRHVDLDATIDLDRRFDLAISLEVAEHLAPERAGSFVATLVALAPIVLFSAAVPGQCGVLHRNEQWPSYWAKLFTQHGYVALDILRPRIWDDAAIAWWYRQNLLLFASRQALADCPALAAAAAAGPAEPRSLVHPELFASTLRAARPRFGRWVRMMPGAIRRSAKRRSRLA